MFDLYYKKNDNSALFESFRNVGITNVQNFIPLYKQFFSLKESNYKNLNLNHHFHIIQVEQTNKRNKYNCIIDSGDKKQNKLCFFKFSPLLDPVKFMVGKYKDLGETKKTSLPELNESLLEISGRK